MSSSLVYTYRGNWYVNLTNRCTATCTFCIKFSWKMDYRGNDLRLAKDAEADDIIAALERRVTWRRQRRHEPFRGEIVFCGYGEPLLRVETLKRVAAWAHARGLKTRANSLGQVNIVTGRNVLAELDGALDGLSISLNAQDESTYDAYVWHRHGPGTFGRVCEFVREAPRFVPRVVVTAVKLPLVDPAAFKRLAESLGVEGRVRPYLGPAESAGPRVRRADSPAGDLDPARPGGRAVTPVTAL